MVSFGKATGQFIVDRVVPAGSGTGESLGEFGHERQTSCPQQISPIVRTT
jgi:hypothetical protein